MIVQKTYALLQLELLNEEADEIAIRGIGPVASPRCDADQIPIPID